MLGLLSKPFVIIPILMVFAGFVIKEKRYPIYLFFFAVLMGILAFYCTIPGDDNDLYWHYITLDSFKQQGFSYFLTFEKTASLPIFSLYFYLISLLPDQRFLPAITAFLVYAINFYMIYKILKKFELNKRQVMVLLVFILCNLNFLGIISGIRFNLAVSLCLLGLYYDLIEKKKIPLSILLYIISMFLHSSMYIIIIVRLLIVLCDGKVRSLLTIGTSILVFSIIKRLPNTMSVFFNRILSESVTELLNKTELYLENNERGAFWSLPLYAIVICFFVYLWIRFYKRYGWGQKQTGKLMIFEVLVLLLSVLFFNNYVVVGRLVIMANISIMPLLAVMLKEYNRKGVDFRVVSSLEMIVIMESFLRLFYYMFLGGYSSIVMK